MRRHVVKGEMHVNQSPGLETIMGRQTVAISWNIAIGEPFGEAIVLPTSRGAPGNQNPYENHEMEKVKPQQ